MRQIHAAEGNPFLQPLLLIDLLVQPGRGCQYGGGVQGSLGKKMQEVYGSTSTCVNTWQKEEQDVKLLSV